ncbi:MAG: DUF1801 domain-containing protein, partial [Planctomycetes bacterium]|nr:DUF1801 domain-containing protein [Planctomycetota bacterium]
VEDALAAVGRGEIPSDDVVRAVFPDYQDARSTSVPAGGVEGDGWFLSLHCFTNYVKLTWLNGASLRPAPPIASKHGDVRYSKVHEGEVIDDAQLTRWIRQAVKLPGDAVF